MSISGQILLFIVGKLFCQKSGIDSLEKSGLIPDPLRENLCTPF
jgi:hypothetical protein